MVAVVRTTPGAEIRGLDRGGLVLVLALILWKGAAAHCNSESSELASASVRANEGARQRTAE